jgi:hypothetical protein
VRYLLVIVTEMGFGDASRALTWLRTLQDRIGDWHDLEALEEEIIAIVASPEFMKQHLAASSQMPGAAASKEEEALVSRSSRCVLAISGNVTAYHSALRRRAVSTHPDPSIRAVKVAGRRQGRYAEEPGGME